MKDKKLVIALVLIIVLLLIAGAYLFGRKSDNQKISPIPKNYESSGHKGEYPTVDNSQLPKDYSDKTTGSNSWITDSKIGVTYNSKWQVTPELYQTPAQQENGEPLSIVGYRFTLPSGNTISWGGPQSGCIQNEIEKFKYGVSLLACVKGMKAHTGLSDVRLTLPKEDINLFGDFVLKNQ